MIPYRLRPISDRTMFTGRHVDSPFRGTRWSTTRDDLDRELHALGARNVILEVDFRESDLRLDGELRADARCLSPAVRLAFDSRHGPLIYATDKFRRPSWGSSAYPMTDWQHNVRAIALGLEALRKVDRYGISRRGEQYAGYKALPSGSGAAASHMTLDEARDLIIKCTPEEKRHLSLRECVRWAKAAAHPDRHGGDRALWDQVEQAVRTLERAQ